MRNEIIETGKTPDAAIEAACQKLGCSRDDCEFEIIDLPRKSFFGLKTYPARVKVWVETQDEFIPAKVPAPVKETVAVKEVTPVKEEIKPKAAENNKNQDARPKQDKLQNTKPQKSYEKNSSVNTSKERQAEKEKAEAQESPASEVFVPESELTDKEKAARDYVSGILKSMKLDNQVEIIRENGGICVKILGNGLGVIIGRRGETLDSVQYLTGLVVNRFEGDYLRVTIDCGDYRVKRQETLQDLAKRVSQQVLRTNISKTMEPMNPFERRIIHSTVSNIEGVISTSIGEEPNRRVVITTPTARRPSRGASGPPRRSGGPGGPKGGRPERPSVGRSGGGRPQGSSGRDRSAPKITQPPADGPKETPDSSANGSLYSKIDLD